MSPGRAADILRTVIAQKGSCAGISPQDVHDAIGAAPVGTSLGVHGTSVGRFSMVKLADGWGKRNYVAAVPYVNDKHGCMPAGTPLKHQDLSMGLAWPLGIIRMDTINLPADAPTAEAETMLRRFCAAMHLHHVSDEMIASFLVGQS